jgi:hypothetical protein
MSFVDTIRGWFRREPADPSAEAEAKRLAYDRDSIRLSQQMAGRGSGSAMAAPTSDVLRPGEDERGA